MVRNNKGFSLIELMVVVAIIGVLSAIAIPQINKYMARARQTEAKTNLAAIYTSNKAFYAEYNIYDSRFDIIGFRPEGRLRYNTGWTDGSGQCNVRNYGFTGDDTPTATNAVAQCGVGADPGAAGCIVLNDGDQTLNNSTLACETAFTAAAAGKIATGGDIDEWTIDQNKTLDNRNDGTQ